MKKPFNVLVRNEASAPAAEVFVSGFIGEAWWDDSGMSERKFLDAFGGIPEGRKTTIYINSEGGSIKDGLGIHSAIARRSADVTAVVTGYALSIASVIPLAASKVISTPGSMWMLHKPWTGAEGNADAFRKAAEALDTHQRSLVAIYSSATGKDESEINAAIDKETWLDAKEALAWGLADEISGESEALAYLDSSRFRRMPMALGAAQAPRKEDTQTKGTMENEKQTPTVAEPKQTPQAKAQDNDNRDTAEGAALMGRIHALEAGIKAERDTRIRADVATECKRAGIMPQAESWTKRALADESVLADLRGLPPHNQGTDPVTHAVEGGGNALLDKYEALGKQRSITNARARIAMRAENFAVLNALKAQANRSRAGYTLPVFNANTVAAGLTPDVVGDQLIVQLYSKLAALSAFSTQFSTNPIAPKSTVQVKLATAGSTTLTNPTNWEAGDSTLAAAPVTVNQIVQPFQVSQADANNGVMLEDLVAVNAAKFAKGISDVWTAKLLTATYGSATVIGTAANFDSADIPPILALAKDYVQKFLILDGGYTARLQALNTQGLDWRETGAFGFDRIMEQNVWTGAATNTQGFVCNKAAIAIAAGVPILPASSHYDMQETQTVPMLELPVVYSQHFNTATRTIWGCFDIMFGAAAGDATAGEILTSV